MSPIPFSKQKNNNNNNNNYHEIKKCSQKLFEIVEDLDGFSGRTLRKLPFMTSVNYIQSTRCSLTKYLDELEKMIRFERKQRNKLKQTKSHASELSEF